MNCNCNCNLPSVLLVSSVDYGLLSSIFHMVVIQIHALKMPTKQETQHFRTRLHQHLIRILSTFFFQDSVWLYQSGYTYKS